MIETVKVFSALSEEFVELYMKHDPVAATCEGIHDYDHELPDDSPDGLKERAAWLRDLDQRLVASVPWQELPIELRVDFALLRSKIAALRADLEEIKVPQKTPSRFPETALVAIYYLLARPFAPLEERKEAILSRLMAVPDYLEKARGNLISAPDVFLEVALEINAAAPTFVDDVVRLLIRQFPGEAERIEHAGGRARAGFLQYQEFLDRDLRAKSGGTFAIGERWMNFKLEREHLLGIGCAQVEALGREQLERTRQMLVDEARRIDSKKDWRTLIELGRQRATDSSKLRETYAAEVARARRFVLEKRVAPLPRGEKLEVVDTPVFQRPLTPFAAYLHPAAYDLDQTGFFYVTPVDLARPKDEQLQYLQSHALPQLGIVTVHEAYPGHHLQRCHANRSGSRLRRLADSPMFAEGWALYCEEVMHETGFYTDPFARLFQLRNLLWRACRVLIDVGLHCGRMTLVEAVDLLVDEAMLDAESAAAEVRRYTLTPTQPMSYLVGRTAIMEIREEARRRMGTLYNLHDFHAALLSSGTLPPSLVREELWEKLGVA